MAIKTEIGAIRLELKLLRFGDVKLVYGQHNRWQSWWKGEPCGHTHRAFGAADQCLYARAGKDG